MDHKKEHRARAETWKFYKEKVVDFLRITCGLEQRFSEEEILHVLGALDVNSVRIHAAADNNIPVSIYFNIYTLTSLVSILKYVELSFATEKKYSSNI